VRNSATEKMQPLQRAGRVILAVFLAAVCSRWSVGAQLQPGNGAPFSGLSQSDLAFLPPSNTSTTNEALANPTNGVESVPPAWMHALMSSYGSQFDSVPACLSSTDRSGCRMSLWHDGPRVTLHARTRLLLIE
jgi:hypothetical protein